LRRRELHIGFWRENKDCLELGENIGMDLGEVGWGGMDWIDLDEDREKWRTFLNTVMSLRFAQNVWKFVA
jgi:hypothetical protein